MDEVTKDTCAANRQRPSYEYVCVCVCVRVCVCLEGASGDRGTSLDTTAEVLWGLDVASPGYFAEL